MLWPIFVDQHYEQYIRINFMRSISIGVKASQTYSQDFLTTMKYLLITLSILLGCSNVDNKSSEEIVDSSSEKVYTALTLDEYKEKYDVKNYITVDPDESKTETIDFDCAVLIYPTDEQIEEMKRQMGEEDFYIVADDNNSYQGIAISLLDSLNIKMVTAKDRYLKLQGHNGSWTLDIRKENFLSWNLIFFKRTKEPEVVSTVDLTIDHVKEYFKAAE
jgi:hypothetical protein